MSSGPGFTLLLAVLACCSVQAQQERSKGNEADESFISLLEFIGEFTTVDGEWIDPVIIEESTLLADEETPDPDNGRDSTPQPVTATPQGR